MEFRGKWKPVGFCFFCFLDEKYLLLGGSVTQAENEYKYEYDAVYGALFISTTAAYTCVHVAKDTLPAIGKQNGTPVIAIYGSH